MNRPLHIDLATLGAVAVFVTGSISLILVMAAGDGTWYLYGQELASGKRLYSDLGANMQPIMPYVSWVSVALFGSTLLGQRLIYFLVLALYAHAIYKIVSLASVRDFTKFAAIVAFFFIATHFEAYRFDDYHAIAQLGVMYSFFLSARFLTGDRSRSAFLILQGLIGAVVLLVRVNEGLAVLACSSFVWLVKSNNVKDFLGAALIQAAIVAGGVALVVFSIGETPATWLRSTFIEASAAKGSWGLVRYPLKLAVDSARYLVELASQPSCASAFLLISVCFGLAIVFAPLRRALPVAAVILMLLLLCVANRSVDDSFFLVVALAALLSYSVFALFVLLAGYSLWDERFSRYRGSSLALACYPFLLFALGALSAGGKFRGGLYFPAAMLVCNLLIWLPPFISFKIPSERIFAVLLLAFAGYAAAYKATNPFSWHSYHVAPIPSDSYQLAYNNSLGYHFIDQDVRDLVQPVCDVVSGRDVTLLSMPFSFANYYCGVRVWNGFIQTFFDTSTAKRIGLLMEKLETNPPDYIFYQRQLENLRGHEIIFQDGSPLPHRKLDEMIQERLNSGQWRVVYESDRSSLPGWPSQWYLIKTEP